MKKIMIRVLLVMLALIIGYLVFNQIDARPNPSKLGAPPAPAPESFDKSNGYYRLWTLIEPKDVDIETDAAILPYRRLADPAFDNDRYIKEFNHAWKEARKNYQHPEKLKPAFDVMKFKGDWRSSLSPFREQLTAAAEEYGFMLARYEKLINCETFIDFTLIRFDFPIPHLLAWLHTAKLSIALDIMTARNGNSPEAVAHLLRHLHFAVKVIPNSRTLITNLVSKAVARLAIWALNDIMNQKDCPPDVYQTVLDGTPTLAYEAFGSRFPFECETYWFSEITESDQSAGNWLSVVKNKLLFQENRTRNIRVPFMEGIIRYEETPPRLWNEDIQELPRQAQGAFWWLQNPLGKKRLDDEKSENFVAVVYKSWALKAWHDMLHIAADLHRSYDPTRPIQSQFNDLPSYRELLDPCSGKPYIWNEAKQVLYSIGIDRRDNQGDTRDYQAWQDSDYALPVIMFVR
ncbi:MAG: hypothetical protein JXI33_01070 [Candidatus Aminicenantes bacterium]|nr:hypothetical protein [Candidatus Aminicenantes bacterium]